MKKRLVALVALAAMVLSMLPVAAFGATANDINISVFSFNNDVEQNENVLIAVKGDDVEKGMRVVCYLKGIATPFYNGIIESNDEDIIYVPKKNIPNIDDQSKKNVLTVNVTNDNGSTVYKSATFTQDYVSVMPTAMNVSIDAKGGVTNRSMTFTFNEGYVADDSDRIKLESFNANGTSIKTQYEYVKGLTLHEDGTLSMREKIETFGTNAVKVRATFQRDGEDVSKLSQTLNLDSPYGELDKLELDFGTTTIEQGATLTGKLYYVNTDGKRYDITDEADSFNVTATDSGVLTSSQTPSTPTVTVADNAKVGAKITMLAFYYGTPVNASLTVVSDTVDGKVKMSKTSFDAGTGKDQLGMEFTLLDSKGNTKKLDFFPTNVQILWVESSNSSAKLNVIQTDQGSNLQREGILRAALQCDTPCTGKFELVLTDNNGHAYRAVSDTFTFTDPNTKPDGASEVTVTIGSKTMEVDGKDVAIIAPPIIDKDRTYVPLRAISQAFGGTVDYKDDGTNKTITIDRGNTHITMTPYRLAYTINGQQKQMDVAPYISTAYSSTMVPVRFIADAFGFDIDVDYNADDTTRAVTFTAK